MLTIKLPIPFAAAVAIAAAAPLSVAQDWPQWQGPNRDAVSPATGLLGEWPAGGPPLAWRVDGLGDGFGGPAIASGRIIGMSRRDSGEVVWARSVENGELLWETPLGSVPEGGMRQGSEGAGGTPTIDGDRVYALGYGGALACVEVASGEVVWRAHLIDDFGGHLPTWRYNESVLVDGDTVLCTPGGNEATLLALGRATGEVRWKSVLPGHTDDTESPDLMGTLPVFLALDANGDRELSSREITASVDALMGLDGNGDSELDEREVRGQDEDGDQRRRRRGPGFMSTLKALHALDANESGTIEKGEIEGAPEALQALDANGDGKLAQDEVGERFPRPKRSGAGYSSAIAVEIDGVRQYVQFTASAVVGVAADDGRLLWSYENPSNRSGINCSTPIYLDGYVIAASAYRNGGGMARVSRDDSGAFQAEEVWFSQDMRNHHGGMIVVDGALYGANGGNGGGHLACLDLESGRTLWDAADLDGVDVPKGSIAMADGRLYYRTEDGAVLLIEPNRERYVERGRFEQPDRTSSPAWTHPVIADGMLYIRDQDTLFCYDIRANTRQQ